MEPDVHLPIDALERRCGIPQGLLARIGLSSIEGILEYRESKFIEKFRIVLGAGSKAQLLYRCALTVRRYLALARVGKAANPHNRTMTGVADADDPRALAGAATWTNQFPRPSICAPANSVGGATSPAAYAANLYQIAQFWEAADSTAPDSSSRITLATRRSDIASTPLSDVSMTQPVPKIELVNHALAGYVQANASTLTNSLELPPKAVQPVEVLISRLRYPGTQLPYHEAHDQTLQALLASNLSFAEIGRVTNPEPPAFVQPTQSATAMGLAYNAQFQASRLSPSQIALLTDAKPDFTDEDVIERYCGQNYGSGDVLQVINIDTFASMTGLSISEIRSMLCVAGSGDSAFTVTASKNFLSGTSADASTGSSYGARYVGQSGSIFIQAPASDSPDSPVDLYVNKTPIGIGELYWLNNMYRLKTWTGLPFDELDSILNAFLSAGSTAAIDWNTLRGLGFFQTWSKDFGLTARQTRALFSTIEYMCVDDKINQFDAIFNSSHQAPLNIGGTQDKYSYVDSNPTTTALCAALQIDENTFGSIAAIVATAQKTDTQTDPGKLSYDIACYTALYRLVMVPRILKIPVPVFLALLERIPNGDKLRTALASSPTKWNTTPQDPTTSDYLDWLWSLGELIMYLRDVRVTPEEMVLFLPTYSKGTFIDIPGTQAEARLVYDVCAQLPAAGFAMSDIASLDLPKKDNSSSAKTIDWSGVVTSSDILDGTLIKVATDADRRQKIQAALAAKNYTVTDATSYDSLMTLFTQALDAQYQVTDYNLSRMLSMESGQIHEMMQAFGAQNEIYSGPSYQFLSACWALGSDGEPNPNDSSKATGWKEFMQRYTKLVRQAALVKRHQMSVAALNLFKQDAASYFGLDTAILTSWLSPPFCLPTMYALDAYSAWVHAAHEEDSVLQYLRDFKDATASAPIATKATAVLAGQLGIEAEKIQAAADWVSAATAGTGVITNAMQMGKVLALLGLSQRSRLSVAALLTIPTLQLGLYPITADKTSDVYYQAWQSTASSALSALADVASND